MGDRRSREEKEGIGRGEKGMKFLITGVAGFVGYHLAKHLISCGHEVIGLLRTSPTKPIDGVEYIAGDVTNLDTMKHLRAYKFDGVFHLASLTHPPTSFKEPVNYFKTNAIGSVNVCEAFGEESVIMQCSTPEVYGICPEEEIFETFPIHPMNPYGVSKAAADLYFLERTRNDSIRGFITRAGSHTGCGRPSCYSISSDAFQIMKIKKGLQEPIIKVGNIGSQRAVIDVRDIVIGYEELMIRFRNGDIANGEVFHISGRKLQSMEYYLDMMLAESGVKATKEIDRNLVRKIDIPRQLLNSDKMRNLTGWFPIIPVEDMLKSLLKYWEVEIESKRY